MLYTCVELMSMERQLRPKLWKKIARRRRFAISNYLIFVMNLLETDGSLILELDLDSDSVSNYSTLEMLICFVFYSICLSRYHAIHRDVYKWFNISFDEFGRTSTPQQTEVCQAIFKKLMENNWLSENTMQQVYRYFCLYLT